MGDRKPKKNSSGNADAHKAKKGPDMTPRDVAKPADKKGNGKG